MNIANLIREKAKLHPERVAVTLPRWLPFFRRFHYEKLYFFELEERAANLAEALQKRGLSPGNKVLMFLRPSLDFPVVVLALLKSGLVPVFIDPGMGLKSLLRAVYESQPKALFGVPKIYFLKFLFRKFFSSIQWKFADRRRWWFPFVEGARQLSWGKRVSESSNFSPGKDDLAAVLYTSGGTGTPKGVLYTHSVFRAQVRLLQEAFSIGEEDVDMPGFPLFSLLTLSMGTPSVLAPFDPAKPARAPGRKILQVLHEQKVTIANGSPAIWKRVLAAMQHDGRALENLRALILFGAPISAALMESYKRFLPQGDCYTPYGATECLPVTLISGKELQGESSRRAREGHGTCVGKPVIGTQLAVVAPPKEGSLWQVLSSCEVGEIVVQGPQLSLGYLGRSEATTASRVEVAGRQGLWHRMGDFGYLDGRGQLWFCGRCQHAISRSGGLLYAACYEAVFNQHPEVNRTALVGGELPQPWLTLVVERKDGKTLLSRQQKDAFFGQLAALSLKLPHEVIVREFKLRSSLPVDTRHNIKIDRLLLRDELSPRGSE